MTTRQQRRIGATSLVLLGLVFVAAVTANNTLLSGLRIDLTENDLYTVAPGTRALLSTIDEPVHLYFFFSDAETADIPQLRIFAVRVRELLEEFAAAANGRLILHVVDPAPFSEDEDRATQFGLQPIDLGLGQTLYFGLAGTNSVGEEQVIGIFSPEREQLLEYEIAKMIYSLARPDKVVVGLLSDVSMTAGFNPQTQQMTDPWVITNQANQLFDVRTLTAGLDRIEDDVDVLWLVHPKALDPNTLYAIDQFILRGGRALIFLDPFAEIDMASAMDPQAMAQGSASNLEPLLSAWGVEFSAAEVVGDNRYALSVSTGLGVRPVRHLALLGMSQEAIDGNDVVTTGLSSVNMGSAGYFTVSEDSDVTLQPLMVSSPEAAPLPAIQIQMLSDPEALLSGFAPTGETYVLAARLEGPLDSAFPDGPPQEVVPDLGGGVSAANETTPPADHVASTEAANLILVGDVDLLSNRMWVQVQNFLGQQLATAFASNGDFVINALDNLSGSADLIGIRARGTYSRPFTRVEALRRDADAEFRQTEQRLQAELAETEENLSALQAARTDEGSLLMSEEQQTEIQRFLDQQVRIRQELRGVQRNLDRNIEQLGTMLQVANIALVPLLLTVLALLSVWLRRRASGKRP